MVRMSKLKELASQPTKMFPELMLLMKILPRPRLNLTSNSWQMEKNLQLMPKHLTQLTNPMMMMKQNGTVRVFCQLTRTLITTLE